MKALEAARPAPSPLYSVVCPWLSLRAGPGCVQALFHRPRSAGSLLHQSSVQLALPCSSLSRGGRRSGCTSRTSLLGLAASRSQASATCPSSSADAGAAGSETGNPRAWTLLGRGSASRASPARSLRARSRCDATGLRKFGASVRKHLVAHSARCSAGPPDEEAAFCRSETDCESVRSRRVREARELGESGARLGGAVRAGVLGGRRSHEPERAGRQPGPLGLQDQVRLNSWPLMTRQGTNTYLSGRQFEVQHFLGCRPGASFGFSCWEDRNMKVRVLSPNCIHPACPCTNC